MIVPWEETTPPIRYGGIERVVSNLTDCLVDQGHKVIVFGTGDSKVKGTLLPIFNKATRQMPHSSNPLAREAYIYLGISRVIEKLNNLNLDIIHNHLGWRLLMFNNLIKQPMITTLHLSLDNKHEQTIYNKVKNHNFISISNSQRSSLPKLNYVKNIYNGININNFSFNPKPGKYLAFLGSFTAHKGPDKAIEIAKKTGKKLIMAGKVDPLEIKYFNQAIKPHIDNKQISFIGEVNELEKDNLLKNAEALLMPISWNEPFGLVMVESMACGTPVIALNLGSVSEIIDHNIDGFICKDIKEMVSSATKVRNIKRQLCRVKIENKFTQQIMTNQYLSLYQNILSQSV